MPQLTINAETGSSGGQARGIDNSWATVRGQTNADDADQNSARMASNFSGGSYFIRRGFLKYDLTGIPSGSTIDAVTYQPYCLSSGSSNDDSTSLEVVVSTADDNIGTNDYNNITFSSLGSINLSSINQDDYSDITLNSTGIDHVKDNLTNGSVKFAHITGRDLSNSAPGGDNECQINDGDAAQPTRIVVTYTSPGGILFMLT